MADNDVCKNQGFLDMLSNRRYAFTYNVPPPRIDSLANSPYQQTNTSTGTLYTQFDLNMRRKSEILKYSSNLQSTQTNNFTKSQKWAQIVNGNYQKYSPTLYSQGTNPTTGAQISILTCNEPGGIIKTPSYACDVPGPLTYIYEDQNVNLYMYRKNVDAYALIPNPNLSQFLIQNLYVSFVIPNSLINYTPPAKFSKVIVMNGVLNSLTIFTVSVPVAIRIQGRVTSSDSYTATYSFQTPALNVYYSDTNQPNTSMPYNANSNPNSSYSVSGNYITGGPSNTITFTVPDPTQPYIFDMYIGTVQFSSLLPLQTQPQFVYTFAMSYIKILKGVVWSDSQTNTSYQVIVNPPYPSSSTYYKNNVSFVTIPTVTYAPMSILYN